MTANLFPADYKTLKVAIQQFGDINGCRISWGLPYASADGITVSGITEDDVIVFKKIQAKKNHIKVVAVEES